MARRVIPATLGMTNFKIGSYSPSQERYLRPYAADDYISEVGTTRFKGTFGLYPRDKADDQDLIGFNVSLDNFRNFVRIPLPEQFRPTTPANSGASFRLTSATLNTAYSRRNETFQATIATSGVTADATVPVTRRSWINIGNELYKVMRVRSSNYGQTGGVLRLDLYPNRLPLAITTPRGWQTLYTIPPDIPVVGFGGMVVFRRKLILAITNPSTFGTALYEAAPTAGTGWSIREIYRPTAPDLTFYGSGLAVAQLPGRTEKELYAFSGGNTISLLRINLDDINPENNSQELIGRYTVAADSRGTFLNAAVGWQSPDDPEERLYFMRDDNKLYRVTELRTDGVIANTGSATTAVGTEHLATFPGVFAAGMAAFGASFYVLTSGGSRFDVDRFDASRGLNNIVQTRILDVDASWNGSFATSLDVWNGILIATANQGTPRTNQIGKANLTPDSASIVEINNPFVNARVFANRDAGYPGDILDTITYDWQEVSAVSPPVDLYLPPLALENLGQSTQ